MLLGVSLDPALAIVERSMADVDVPEDDHVAALTHEGVDAGFEVIQKVELVRKSGIVRLVWTVEVEDDEKANNTGKERWPASETCRSIEIHRAIVLAVLTRNRGRRPDPPCPAF